jgi:hypothetical protein
MISFRIWSPGKAVPDIAELSARQESVTGLRCAFAVHQEGALGWVEMSAVPSASPATACMLSRSTDPSVVLRSKRDLRPTRTEILHSLRLAKAVYYAGTAPGRTDFTRLLQLGLTWALAHMTRGIIAGDASGGQFEYWWSDAFLDRVERLRKRVDAASTAAETP